VVSVGGIASLSDRRKLSAATFRGGNVLVALVVEPVSHRASAVTLQHARGV